MRQTLCLVSSMIWPRKSLLHYSCSSVSISSIYVNVQVLAKKLPADQLNPFIYRLMDGLIDVESHSSSGACVVLNSFCRLRGAELTDEVRAIDP